MCYANIFNKEFFDNSVFVSYVYNFECDDVGVNTLYVIIAVDGIHFSDV